ncbi:uncharacterized protein kcnk4a [Nerophis lumbriciformis]|uniref:uncharacterized protein kcnk4a n=1 Tax=Nerophis lumbriciformis TaxID=546530 RepID=UPI002ADFE3E2|nr:potassium channel subfamily K member 4-like [Nerophis lumbriciformis]
MRCTTLLALLLGVVLYLCMGALVFQNLEASEESVKFQELLEAKNNFLNNHSCVSEREFYKLVKGVTSAVEAGLEVSSISTNFTSRWDVASAFFFCGAIITTIGFGNLSPRTWYGQLFCLCYALVGIPMFGILLAGVGDHMGTVLRRAVAKIETLFLKRKVRPTTVRVSSAVLSILVGCLIFLAVPTVVFQESEDWSFLESLYFVVITLTTVGFGDFVPDGSHAGGLFFKPLVWLWIVFGLAYFASILTMIGNWLRVLSKKTRAEMEELRAHATDWTQHMSKDFRLPNPLEFNDPFLLQRRRWKRSERRRIRRGAQGTLGYRQRSGAENGHLPNHWAGLSGSMGRLEVLGSSLERKMMSKPRSRLSAAGVGGGTIPRARPAEPGLQQQVGRRSLPHLLLRSFSMPVANSASELDSPEAAGREGSLSGSESPFDSRSDISSASSSFSDLRWFRARRPVCDVEGGGASSQDKAKEEMKHSSLAPLPPHRPNIVLNDEPSGACQLLDFFGENLAYIDESSDTLSERALPAEERRRRARKPKKRSVRRKLSQRWSPLQVRRPSSDMQPPSNPPTPPPDLSASDLNHKDSPPAL